MKVLSYTAEMQGRWDEFVDTSKNGTFLFYRGYMDYHSERFPDASIIVIDDHERWLAILPATRRDETLLSHEGLTYGGFVTNHRMTVPAMLSVFEAVASHLRRAGIEQINYKAIPHIYHRLPAEEDLYALFRAGAVLHRRDVSSALEPMHPAEVQERRRRGMVRARRAHLEVRLATDQLGNFWRILEANLERRHGTRPVHCLDDFRLLAARFPDQIALHAAFSGTEMLAGVIVYRMAMVAHAQYIASADDGREVGALDLIFDTLINETYRHVRYFDFGVSSVEGGRVLNQGLIEQKEGFGARAVTYDHYTWALGRT